MNILVTGGCGFIGSHLCVKLMKEGHEITIIDNLHNYYSTKRKLLQLDRIKHAGDFIFQRINLLDFNACKSVFKDANFDVVIHFAALPGVSYSIKAPLDYIDYDIKATVNVLKLAGESQVKHVIFASSSSVYGDIYGFPLKEEMASGRVISPYAASKYSAESFCHAYQALYGFSISILRFFTVFGPYGRPDMAITTFMNNLIQGKPIKVFGTKTARDYTYVDDIVSGVLLALKHERFNEVYNIGSGRPITMEMLLDALKGYFPKMNVIYEPHRKGDVKETWADISKAQSLLGYKPMYSFAEGIERTVEWAEKHEAYLY